MANHAVAYTGKKLDHKEIHAEVVRLNDEFLSGIFDIHYSFRNNEEHYWLLNYKGDGHIGIEFWITDEFEYGTEESGEYVEYETPKLLSEQSGIEFRHGHGFNFLWWVEGVFRENLGKKYSARMWDDGVGWETDAPKPERYTSFKTYVLEKKCKDKKKMQEYKNFCFPEWEKEGIPKEIIKKLDLDFKI